MEVGSFDYVSDLVASDVLSIFLNIPKVFETNNLRDTKEKLPLKERQNFEPTALEIVESCLGFLNFVGGVPSRLDQLTNHAFRRLREHYKWERLCLTYNAPKAAVLAL